MAKRQIKKGVCSFCLNEYPQKEMYVVSMPMHRLEDGTTHGIYRTICCEKCIDKKNTKERILNIHESPNKK